MKTTVEVSDALLAEAKALAAREGVPFRALVEEGLRSAIERRSLKSGKGFRLRDGRFHGRGGLRASINWSDLGALASGDKLGGCGD